jgi:hypothetical protein
VDHWSKALGAEPFNVLADPLVHRDLHFYETVFVIAVPDNELAQGAVLVGWERKQDFAGAREQLRLRFVAEARIQDDDMSGHAVLLDHPPTESPVIRTGSLCTIGDATNAERQRQASW